MRCPKAKDFISREMDEQLPPDVTVKLTEHLDSCRGCREYRDDLLVGQRMIAATAPVLPDNFDWKLQLKLNQTLQHAAGETAYPWAETDQDKGLWLRNFGAAAAVGMAAVLALAMFLGPVSGPSDSGRGLPSSGSSALVNDNQGLAGRSDRLPLFATRPNGGGLYGAGIQRSVSAVGETRSRTGLLDRGWAGHDIEDLRTIQRLKRQNDQLNRILFRQQQVIQGMRAHLDTIDTNALDLEQE
jgi:hypothetical protein